MQVDSFCFSISVAKETVTKEVTIEVLGNECKWILVGLNRLRR